MRTILSAEVNVELLGRQAHAPARCPHLARSPRIRRKLPPGSQRGRFRPTLTWRRPLSALKCRPRPSRGRDAPPSAVGSGTWQVRVSKRPRPGASREPGRGGGGSDAAGRLGRLCGGGEGNGMGREPGLGDRARLEGSVPGRGAPPGERAGSGRANRMSRQESASHLPGWVTPQLVASPPPSPGCHRPLTPRAAAGGRSVAGRWRGAGGSLRAPARAEGTGRPGPGRCWHTEREADAAAV